MIDASESSARLRIGRASIGTGGRWSAEWNTRANCSLTPRQLMLAYAIVCGFSLAVAGFFWAQGVRLVLPFAGLELVGLAAALMVHARHVGDAERIAVDAARLTIDRQTGGTRERVEFEPDRVRVERPESARSLVRLRAQGRQVAVGRHVQSHLRPQLADELRWALRVAR